VFTEAFGEVGDVCEEILADEFAELQMPVLKGTFLQRKSILQKYPAPGRSVIDILKYIGTVLLSVSYLMPLSILYLSSMRNHNMSINN
jgi:hypothetical protein